MVAEAEERLAVALKEEARASGFSLAGIAHVGPSDHASAYRAWLEKGYDGEMAYLAREDSVTRRAELRRTMASVRSALVVAHEYFAEDPPGIPDDPARAVVARYARGDDYHKVVKKKLLRLADWVRQRAGTDGIEARAYVDTGPILERELARRAGVGWFGKNTMVIHPRRGSYFFIGVLLLNLDLPADAPFEADHCGTCRACVEACPTGALLGRDGSGAPVMDARLCISYLTIELRGHIPESLRPLISNRVFGCDICQEVCPWNTRFAEPAGEPAYRPRPELDGPALISLAETLLDTDESGFRRLFRRSPVRRTGRDGLLRNVCVALGNWGAVAAVPILKRALHDGSDIVRSHAAWALDMSTRGGSRLGTTGPTWGGTSGSRST